MKKTANEVISPNPPLLVKEWSKKIGAVKASRSKKDFLVQVEKKFIGTDYSKKTEFKINKKEGSIQILVRSRDIGKLIFPPDIKVEVLSKNKLRQTKLSSVSHGLFPDHLDRTQFPGKLDKKLQVRQRFQMDLSKLGEKKLVLPTTIFPGDQRYVFGDTSFPWCTGGKVETEAGWGSGVMIGPRHFMTASHVVVWKPNNSCGWLKFTPLKFDNSEPFGHAWATKVYSWNKADGSDGLNLTEGAFDYVVVVLDTTIGNLTGWMGSRGYDSGWDGGNYWGHIGYPQDLAGGSRPSFIGYQAFDREDSASVGGRNSFQIQHKIDVIPGQSGGPYFGWWDGEAWPRVVGIQSGQTSSFNTCGGGNPLSELINYARNVEP